MAKYAFENINKETMAKASSRNLSISTKKSVETCKFIRNKKVDSAIYALEMVLEKKMAIPYTRFFQESAHQKGRGIDNGGYPINVVKEVLRLLKAAKKNASEAEISGTLYVISASARQGPSRLKMGRYPGREAKNTHLEIIVGVKESSKKKTKNEVENK